MKNRLFKLLLAAFAGTLLVGCYNDYDNPAPGIIYTDEIMQSKGLTYISIKDLKAKFYAEKGQPDAILGNVASLTIEKPLYTRGKVISSDRAGNLYKSVYLYDEATESAIELKLSNGIYIFHPVGQIVFIDLQTLVLGNYRGSLSIGTWSNDPKYSNDNIETKVLTDEHIFSGERLQMLSSDTLVIKKGDYTTKLTDAALGRLVRFEGVKSQFGMAGWGYKNTFPNYFANSTSYDVTKPGWENIPEWATWATKRRLPDAVAETYFYGSAWFTYVDVAPDKNTSTPGNYVVRTSGYASFREGRIPDDGTIVDITAIYTKFGTSTSNAAYQLLLNRVTDVVKH